MTLFRVVSQAISLNLSNASENENVLNTSRCGNLRKYRQFHARFANKESWLHRRRMPRSLSFYMKRWTSIGSSLFRTHSLFTEERRHARKSTFFQQDDDSSFCNAIKSDKKMCRFSTSFEQRWFCALLHSPSWLLWRCFQKLRFALRVRWRLPMSRNFELVFGSSFFISLFWYQTFSSEHPISDNWNAN